MAGGNAEQIKVESTSLEQIKYHNRSPNIQQARQQRGLL